MAFRIVWTDPALAQLRAILDFIAKDSPTAALKFAEAIMSRVEVLVTSPFSGEVYSRARRRSVREILHGSYRIFYRVRENDMIIEVLTVWHAARKNPNL